MRMGKAMVFGGLLLMSGVVDARHDWDDEYDYEEVFSCESHNHDQEYCDVGGHGGVVLVNQLSRSPCIEGQTWGQDRRGVWVSDGCRAEFALGGGRGWGGRRHGDDRYDQGLPDPYPARGGGAYTVRCESRNHDYTFCSVPIRGSVDIERQLSDSYCEYEDTWGYDRRGIWVDEGCRADFVIYN